MENTKQGMFIRLTKQQHHILKKKSKKDGVPIANLIRLAVSNFLNEGGYGNE